MFSNVLVSGRDRGIANTKIAWCTGYFLHSSIHTQHTEAQELPRASLALSPRGLQLTICTVCTCVYYYTVLPEPLISSPPDTEAEPTSTTPNTTGTTPTIAPSTGKILVLLVWL